MVRDMQNAPAYTVTTLGCLPHNPCKRRALLQLAAPFSPTNDHLDTSAAETADVNVFELRVTFRFMSDLEWLVVERMDDTACDTAAGAK